VDFEGTNARKYYELQSKFSKDVDVGREFIKGELKNLKQEPNRTLLDLGCGDGRDMKYYKKLGFDVSGIDSSQEAINNARKKGLLNLVNDSLFNLNTHYTKNSFDVIVARYSHHLINESLKKLYEKIPHLLKPRGIFLAVFPNLENYKVDSKGEVSYSFFNGLFNTSCKYRSFDEHRKILELFFEDGLIEKFNENDGFAGIKLSYRKG